MLWQRELGLVVERLRIGLVCALCGGGQSDNIGTVLVVGDKAPTVQL